MVAAEDLPEPAERVTCAAVNSELVDFSVGDPELDNPRGGASWNEARSVDAGLLIELLADQRSAARGPLRTVKIKGARITGRLDLAEHTLTRGLHLENCYFAEPVSLDGASASGLSFRGCYMSVLNANQLHTTGNLRLDEEFTATIVELARAHIGGFLSLSGAHLANPGLPCLRAEQIVVDQGLFCDEGFTTDGEVCLIGARIGGPLELSGAHLSNPGGSAFAGDQISVDMGLVGVDRFTAEGEVILSGARIGGQLDMSGARLSAPDGDALCADGLTIDQGMFCRDEFTAEGEVRLPGARIGGQFNLSGAHLTNPEGVVLNAEQISINQDMFADRGFTAVGEIRLNGAHIGGQLALAGAHLGNSGGRALTADGMTVDEGIFGHMGFSAQGELRLLGARVAHLVLSGARLTNPGAYALNAEQLVVDRDMSCGDGFAVDGEFRLLGAHIGGQLELSGARLMNTSGYALQAAWVAVDQSMFCDEGFTAEAELCLIGARISGQLVLADAVLNHSGTALDLSGAAVDELILMFAMAPAGDVNLTNSRVSAFHDDPATWPTSLWLRGFAYGSLENNKITLRERLRWLKHHEGGYAPQIYDQLAAVYRTSGRSEDARRVGIAKQWRRRRWWNPWNWLLYITIGYGYRTWLAAIWLAVLICLGTPIFDHANATHHMQPSAGPVEFHATAYTIDTVIPVVDLGQRTAWTPDGPALYWSWGLIAAGWFLTTAAVAGLSGIFKRD